MGKVFDGIDDTLQRWIAQQPMFFVATAPLSGDGHVNVSPRGHDSFSVLDRIGSAWVDYTGSGIETIAHLKENGRICVMFCSFDRRPRIVRLHGRGRVAMPGHPATTSSSRGTRITRAPARWSSSTSPASATPAVTACR